MERVANASRTKVKKLADYKPPAFLIDKVDLNFDLRDGETIVTSVMTGRRNPDGGSTDILELYGQDLRLVSLTLDAVVVGEDRYTILEDRLAVNTMPDTFT